MLMFNDEVEKEKLFIPYILRPSWVRIKRKGKCWACRNSFKKEERVVTLQFTIKGKKIYAPFHWSCLKTTLDHWFDINPIKLITRTRRGRASCKEFQHKRRNLVSLRCYHKKRGNSKTVEELTKAIEELEV